MTDFYSLTLHIRRYNPDTKKYWTQEYFLKTGRILRFTDLFRKINKEQDPSLAWNSSCEHAQCGSCAVVVNGRPLLSCELLVENAVAYFGTTVFKISPLSIAPVLRDLIVDLEAAYDRVHQVKPYIIHPSLNPNPGHEYRLTPQILDQYVEATRCIHCFCCAEACPSSAKGFLGPNAMLAGAIRLMDPRDESREERLKTLYSDQGVYRCHTAMACSHVCPKNIDVAHFIGLVKEGKIG